MSKTLILLLTLLGGFRGIVSEVIWFRMDRLQDEGRYSELAQLADVLVKLEPKAPEVWTFAAWNLAYNVSVMMPTHADRWRWVEAGLRLLRDDGLALNPSEPALYREIAWLFLSKIGGNIDEASPLYAEEWRKRVEKARAAGDWGALAMDPSEMSACEKEFGGLDWTDPKSAALYFARRGFTFTSPPRPSDRDGARVRFDLHHIRYQTLMALSLRDPGKAQHALAAMRAAYAEYPAPQLKELIVRYRDRFSLK